MFCPGCGTQYPTHMPAWTSSSPWVCSACSIKQTTSGFCTECGSQTAALGRVCVPCLGKALAAGAFSNVPPGMFPPPLIFRSVKNRPPPGIFDETIEIKPFHVETFIKLDDGKCQRAGCTNTVVPDEGQTRSGAHRKLCQECLDEWAFASNPSNWPKGWCKDIGWPQKGNEIQAVDKTLAFFMQTSPGSFGPLITGRGLPRGARCPWCKAEVRERPLFQFNFVGCLC